MKTVVGTFNNIQDAYAAANDLVSHGYSRNDISVIASDTNSEYAPYIKQPVPATYVKTAGMTLLKAQESAQP
jgi:hypothetical protein